MLCVYWFADSTYMVNKDENIFYPVPVSLLWLTESTAFSVFRLP